MYVEVLDTWIRILPKAVKNVVLLLLRGMLNPLEARSSRTRASSSVSFVQLRSLSEPLPPPPLPPWYCTPPIWTFCALVITCCGADGSDVLRWSETNNSIEIIRILHEARTEFLWVKSLALLWCINCSINQFICNRIVTTWISYSFIWKWKRNRKAFLLFREKLCIDLPVVLRLTHIEHSRAERSADSHGTVKETAQL